MYWVLLIFLMIGIVYPAIGFIAIICMLGPVVVSFKRGRFWCGNICPRGSFYDKVLSKISPHKPIPLFFRSMGLRYFMIGFIFFVFGWQMYNAWGNIAAMGNVFVQIILITTIVGVILGGIYHHRTWCTFCPMGTLSRLVAPKMKQEARNKFAMIELKDTCVHCKLCHNICPMQLYPDEAKAKEGFSDPDCLKCGKCIKKCPKKALRFK